MICLLKSLFYQNLIIINHNYNGDFNSHIILRGTCSITPGKGSPKYLVAIVKPSRILCEMGGAAENVARKAISIPASKMPMRTQFIIS
jgi:hypothetical protein